MMTDVVCSRFFPTPYTYPPPVVFPSTVCTDTRCSLIALSPCPLSSQLRELGEREGHLKHRFENGQGMLDEALRQVGPIKVCVFLCILHLES
jgi:hypothetical protein